MASSINASTSGPGGVITTADNSGILQLQSGGVTQATISSSGLSTPAASTINTANTFGFKNRVINGDFKISQYNGTTATTGVTNPGTYYIDRFVNYCSSGSVFSLGQNLGAVTPPAGFAYYFGLQNTTASTSSSGQYCNMQHYIEGYNIADLAWGTANAKAITISFWVYSSLAGTYGLALQNGGSSYGYPTTYTISNANTWTYVTVTIPGPTAGTWTSDNSRGITLIWDLGQGSGYRFTAGSWQAANVQGTTGAANWNQTTNATFYITGVQLEIGSQATSFDFRSIGQELALCQRYFLMQAKGSGDVGNAWYYTNTQCSLSVFPRVTMRVYPSVSFASGTYYTLYRAGGSNVISTWLIDNPSTNFFSVYNFAQASGTAGQAGLLRITDANGFIAFSAEL